MSLARAQITGQIPFQVCQILNSMSLTLAIFSPSLAKDHSQMAFRLSGSGLTVVSNWVLISVYIYIFKCRYFIISSLSSGTYLV